MAVGLYSRLRDWDGPNGLAPNKQERRMMNSFDEWLDKEWDNMDGLDVVDKMQRAWNAASEQNKATIAALRKKLRAANNREANRNQQAARRYRLEQDYLPYPEEERE
jgi:hypothetical protein